MDPLQSLLEKPPPRLAFFLLLIGLITLACSAPMNPARAFDKVLHDGILVLGLSTGLLLIGMQTFYSLSK